MRTAFGKKNRMMLGQPRVRLFELKEFDRSAREVEREERLGFEFVTVSMSVSFVPDFGCAFVAADLTFAFSSGSDDSASADAPLVIDMRPREVVREDAYKAQHKSDAKLSGSISPGFAKLFGEISNSNSFQVGGKMMIRDLYAFGLDGPEAGWRFQASLGHELSGIYDGLSFAIKKRKQSPLVAELKIGAEVAVNALLDRWVTMAFGLSQKTSITQRRYELSLS
jgi:hypothetical protein